MTILLANGDFPQSAELRRQLREAERVVCCDGAALALLEFGRVPDVVVGDLDSLGELPKELEGRVVHVGEQETNDLSKAFRHCISQGWRDLTIMGATGRREDHTLGNISLLADFARQAPSIAMLTDYGCFFPMLESGSFDAVVGQQISIFALEGGTAITSKGLKYALEDFVPRAWWNATLNEATESTVSLSFTTGKPLIVFKCHL